MFLNSVLCRTRIAREELKSTQENLRQENYDPMAVEGAIVTQRSSDFCTRNQAVTNGIKVSTITEMNNMGKCFEYKDWPREPISGAKGYCAPIAAYNICWELSRNVIEHIMKTQLHD